MTALVFLAFTIRVLGAESAVATPPRKLDLPARYLREYVRPATVEDASAHILSLMTADERQLFLSTPEDGLIRFHLGLGTGIRNKFGLWGANKALRASIGPAHPDEMSSRIIKSVWEQIRASAGRDAIEKVDAIERTLRAVRIGSERYEWKKSLVGGMQRSTTIGALVEEMNAALESAVSLESHGGLARVRIEAVTATTAEVSVRNRAVRPGGDVLADQPLAELLMQLGPPFGRYTVLYEFPYVRIFDAQTSNNSSAQQEPTSAADDLSAESRSRRGPGLPHH